MVEGVSDGRDSRELENDSLVYAKLLGGARGTQAVSLALEAVCVDIGSSLCSLGVYASLDAILDFESSLHPGVITHGEPHGTRLLNNAVRGKTPRMPKEAAE